jgi:hypothetical protein
MGEGRPGGRRPSPPQHIPRKNAPEVGDVGVDLDAPVEGALSVGEADAAVADGDALEVDLGVAAGVAEDDLLREGGHVDAGVGLAGDEEVVGRVLGEAGEEGLRGVWWGGGGGRVWVRCWCGRFLLLYDSRPLSLARDEARRVSPGGRRSCRRPGSCRCACIR